MDDIFVVILLGGLGIPVNGKSSLKSLVSVLGDFEIGIPLQKEDDDDAAKSFLASSNK